MLIINPAAMHETSLELAELLAKYRFDNTAPLEKQDYCAATVIDGATVPIRPLLLSGIKQATFNFETGARFWITGAGKLLSLVDDQIVAVNYFSANGRYILDVKPAVPVKFQFNSIDSLSRELGKWGEGNTKNVIELVRSGFNGHYRLYELPNGIQLASNNSNLIAHWESSQFELGLMCSMIHSLYADLDTNKFVISSTVKVKSTTDENKDDSNVEVSFNSLTELFDLGVRLDLSIPEIIHAYKYDTPKMVSLKKSKDLKFMKLSDFAKLWNAIELFRLRRESTVMSSARYNAWIKLLSMALTTFQSVKLNEQSPYGGNLRNCLETIPLVIDEIKFLIESSSLFESENQNRLDQVIREFLKKNPSLIQHLYAASEPENHQFFANCESYHGLKS